MFREIHLFKLSHKKSSVPFVQAVLRGSLLHFCFVFFSASIAILLIHVCVAIQTSLHYNNSATKYKINAHGFICANVADAFCRDAEVSFLVDFTVILGQIFFIRK